MPYNLLQDYNIGTGADFFSTTLNNNGGNLLKAIGSYNGYFQGMTFVSLISATRGRSWCSIVPSFLGRGYCCRIYPVLPLPTELGLVCIHVITQVMMLIFFHQSLPILEWLVSKHQRIQCFSTSWKVLQPRYLPYVNFFRSSS